MDGIDGILTLTIIVILISTTLISTASIWVLIGSLIGFLFWNWSPSKIFMGDIGSCFLGLPVITVDNALLTVYALASLIFLATGAGIAFAPRYVSGVTTALSLYNRNGQIGYDDYGNEIDDDWDGPR